MDTAIFLLLALTLAAVALRYLHRAGGVDEAYVVLACVPAGLLALFYLAGYLWGEPPWLSPLFWFAAWVSLVLGLCGVALTLRALTRRRPVLTTLVATCFASLPFVLFCYAAFWALGSD